MNHYMPFKNTAIKNGNTCPYCGEEAQGESTGLPEIDTNKVFLNMVCLECDKEWREIFTLTNMEEL